MHIECRMTRTLSKLHSCTFGKVAGCKVRAGTLPAGCWLLLWLLVLSAPSRALDRFTLHEGSTVYGKILHVEVSGGETLLDLARRYDLGYNQIAAANPGVDPWTPGPGRKILVPRLFLLPNSRPPTGLVVNLAEMRLYYFPEPASREGPSFYTCPVGVGREGYTTRLGIYTVRSKARDPVWVPPPSVLKEEPDLPPRVPPGPGNPLGRYILRFSRLQYGIHGTNRPWGVGRRVSHGCIRLYPEDIERIFPLVHVGSLIQISYEPIKVGWDGKRCYLQVFDDYERRVTDPLAQALTAMDLCERAIGPLKVDLSRIKRALEEKNGVPVEVARAASEE